jgi:hypothetical protein
MKPLDYATKRRRLGSQVEVAKMLRVHVNTVSRRECGTLPIDGEAEHALRFLAMDEPKDPR